MVTQTDTGAARTALSDEAGSFILPNLPIGPYRLEVSLPGFRTYVQTGIVLQVNSSPVINAILQVGQVSEQVEVQADAAMVETRSTSVSTVMDNQRILELPLNGRQATDLVFLTAGATPGTAPGLNSGVRNYPTADITIAGGLETGTIYLLDGGVHNDPFNNLALPLPFPDALQEFRVQTSAVPAQYGHHSAAAVNGVTKSGTNAFHGDLFEFFRDSALNARNAFALGGDGLKRNQFGGTIGGPIMKNKLFFFAGEQITTERSQPSTVITFIPTAAMLAGDFTAIAGPGCNTSGRTIALRTPFANNRVDPGLFSAPAMFILKHQAMPTTTDPCGRFQFARNSSKNTYDTVARVDYQHSDKHTIFTRFLNARLDQPSDFDSKNLVAYSNAALHFKVYSAVLADTYVIGTNTVSNFRGTLNRTVIPKVPSPFFDGPAAGIKMWAGLPGNLRLAITNGFTLTSNLGTPTIYNTTSFQFAEDLSMVRGAHQIGIGANWIWGSFNGKSRLNASGPFSFNGQVYGLGLADFMLGKPSSLVQSNETGAVPRMNYVGAYIQDTWKATPKLTVNAGVRWDPFLGAYAKDKIIAHFDPALFAQGVRSTVFKNAPAGLIFPGDAQYAAGEKFWNNRLGYFAPRIGLAWNPKGDGLFSIRAAYGLLYDGPALAYFLGYSQSSPIGSQVTLNFPPSFHDPWADYPGGNPFPIPKTRDTIFLSQASYQNVPFDSKPTYSQQWNLSMERQFGSNLLVSAAYVGTELVNVWTTTQLNPAVYIPGGSCVINGQTFNPCSTVANVPQRRQLYLQNPAQGQYYGTITHLDDSGTGSYHGMMLSVQRRSTTGLTVQGNYTWSHCISDLIDPEPAVAGTSYLIPGDRRSSRSNCPVTDRRHVFNMSTVYRTPQFSERALRVLASNWQVSGIVTLRAGQYLTIGTGVDQALTGAAAQRANQVLASPYPDKQTLDQWLNPAAFVMPAVGTFGNMAANNVRGPGVISINTSLTRTFRVRESQSLQFRVEAFNLPNHLNPNNPTTAINNVNFGKILSANDPRIMQLALKYVF
jgi:hypothetical protein